MTIKIPYDILTHMNNDLEKKLVEEHFATVQKGDQRGQVEVGDTVNVYVIIKEAQKKKRRLTAAEKQALKEMGDQVDEKIQEKISTQKFSGTVIAIKNKGYNKTITVRKISSNNVGVERIFPLHSTAIEKIEVVKKGNPRRSKLYYLRNRTGRSALRVKQSADQLERGEKQEQIAGDEKDLRQAQMEKKKTKKSKSKKTDKKDPSTSSGAPKEEKSKAKK